MPAFALVGAWGLVAIGVANTGNYEAIKQMAYLCAGVLLLSSSIHALKNRAANPRSTLLKKS